VNGAGGESNAQAHASTRDHGGQGSASRGQGAGVLCIPVYNSDEAVAVPAECMPDDPEEILEILQAENAPLSVWIDAARIYYNTGQMRQYAAILDEVKGPEVEKYYGEKAKNERIQALCALAEKNIDASLSRCHRRDDKDLMLAQAHTHLTEAFSIDPKMEAIEQRLAKGQYHLAKGEVLLARREFVKASQTVDAQREMKQNTKHSSVGDGNCMGYLGMAYCDFVEGKHNDALELYKTTLVRLGSKRCPQYVRLAMAACYLQLQQPEMASLCYERVLSLDGTCAEACAGLAALKVLSPKKADVQQGLALLEQAYKLDHHLESTLVSLCEQMLHRKEYGTVAQLARSVIASNTQDKATVAEAYYYLGFVHSLARDANGDEEAVLCFKSAIASDPTYLSPRKGLAEIRIREGKLEDAVAILEEVAKSSPNDIEALTKLSVLHKVGNEKFKAVQFAQRAVDAVKDKSEAKGNGGGDGDQQVLMLREYLANLLSNMDANTALNHYNTVLAQSSHLPHWREKRVCLVNNIGVMNYQKGDYVKALASFEDALRDAKKGQTHFAEYSIKYNVARAHEALGSLQKAAALYKDLLNVIPGYLECKLRLAAVNFSMGYSDKAIQHCEEALAKFKNNAECLAMLTWIYLQMNRPKLAHDTIRRMKEACKGESDFIEVALGCMYIITAYKESRCGDNVKFQKYLYNAMMSFKQAISICPRNMFAAHGMGVCFAQLGQTYQAKKIFERIQEATKQDVKMVEMPELWQNRGSIFLESGQYQNAWRTYTQCQRKFYRGANSGISQLMAQALNAAEKKDGATKVLLKAIHLDPTNLGLKYCLAVVLKGRACEIIDRKLDYGGDYDRRIEELRVAEKQLILCRFYLSFLKEMDDQELLQQDVKKKKILQMHSRMPILESNLKQQMDTAANVDRAYKARQDAYTAEERIAAREREREEKAKRLAAEEQQKKEEEMARLQEEKLQQLKADWNRKKQKFKVEAPAQTVDPPEFDEKGLWDSDSDDSDGQMDAENEQKSEQEANKVFKLPSKQKKRKKQLRKKDEGLEPDQKEPGEFDDFSDDVDKASAAKRSKIDDDDEDGEKKLSIKNFAGILESDSE